MAPTEPSPVFLLWVKPLSRFTAGTPGACRVLWSELGSFIKNCCRHSQSPLWAQTKKSFPSRTRTVLSKSPSLGECFLLHHLVSSVVRGNQTSGMRPWNLCTNLNLALNTQKCSKSTKRKQKGMTGSMLPWREAQSESTVDFLIGLEVKQHF